MERDQGRDKNLLENIEPNPLQVLNRFQLQLYTASPELRVIIDRLMSSYAQRNNIPYERVTKDLSCKDKIKNLFHGNK